MSVPPKVSRELADAVQEDALRAARDEAKHRAVRQMEGYDVFKNMVAVCAETDYTFPEASALLEAAKSAPTAGAASSAPAQAEAPKVEEKKEEVEDANMGNLFGDDEEY